jgi:uncharacterized protein YjbI with pentapeptide repeats
MKNLLTSKREKPIVERVKPSTNMTTTKTQIRRDTIEDAREFKARLFDNGVIHDAIVEGIVIDSFIDRPLEGRLRNVSFRDCFFTGERFFLGMEGCDFQNCAFRVQMHGMSDNGSRTHGVIIDACNFTACSFSETSMDNASVFDSEFFKCVFANSYLRHGRFFNVSFRESTLHWVDCYGVDATEGLHFASSELFNVIFNTANMKGATFRGSSLFYCQALGARDLRPVDSAQVAKLLR